MPTLRFDADLDVDIDGARAHLDGAGPVLTVAFADHDDLISTVRNSGVATLRRRVVTSADHLAAHGATIRLDSPRGPFLTLGASAHAPALRPFTGTTNIQPASASALLALTPVAPAAVRRSAVVGAILVLVLVGIRAIRSRRG